MSLDGWPEDKKISLAIAAADIGSNLTDFPVLVNLGTSVGKGLFDAFAVFDELASDANRKKIAIEIGDTGNQCFCEIENWDDANETAQLWVKIPQISASFATILNLYYNSAHADNTTYVGDIGDTPAQNVWDINFIAVYHMAQNPSGGTDCILDSTPNENHGTPSGSMTSEDLVDGFAGKAIEFDGSDDNIYSSSPIPVGGSTIECLFNKVGLEETSGILSSGDTIVSGTPLYILQDNNGSIRSYGQLNAYVTYGSAATGEWHMAASARNSSELESYYYDGSLAGTVQRSTSGSGGSLFIGAGYNGYSQVIIGEVRISNVSRSADWLAATNLSLADALITFTLSGATGVTDRTIPAFANIPKPYNFNFLPGFVPAGLIRQNRKGFSKAF